VETSPANALIWFLPRGNISAHWAALRRKSLTRGQSSNITCQESRVPWTLGPCLCSCCRCQGSKLHAT